MAWARPPRTSERGEPCDGRTLEYTRTLKFLVGPFGLYTVLLRDGSILRDVGVTSLIITGRPPIIDSRGGGVPKGIYDTLRTYTVSKVKYVRPLCKKIS